MKKIGLIFLSFFLCFFMIIGCSNSQKNYVDGSYRAEFAEYDDRGYKDFVTITIENGIVSSVVFDATDANGNLRTQDEEYATDMERVQGTEPEQYSADLANQYLATQNVDEVVAVAGATLASDHFKSLVLALEESMSKGKTETVIVNDTHNE